MDFEMALQSQSPSDNLFHFLLKYGSKKELDDIIIKLEIEHPKDPLYFQRILTKKYPNKLWELPTIELVNGLLRLFKNLGITRINELGSEMALLSALLNYYAKKSNFKLEINAYPKFDHDFTNKFTYYPITNRELTDFKNPIIISWLHPKFESELLQMILSNKLEYVFLVGEHVSSTNEITSCQSVEFHNELISNGYKFYLIPFKQVCQLDYISQNKLRDGNELCSRSCTVLYTTHDLNLDDESIKIIVGEENLGIYKELNNNHSIIQDIIFFNNHDGIFTGNIPTSVADLLMGFFTNHGVNNF
jgi:hypothetical protein